MGIIGGCQAAGRHGSAETIAMQKRFEGLLEALVLALALGLAIGELAFAFSEWAASGFAN
ncbi:MAG: hypothetical protein WBE59_15900 [Candidatus Cybelea sp.]